MPFPSTRMIPENWSAHHAQYLPTSMNAVVTVKDPARATPGAFDPEDGTYTPSTPFVVVAGTRARIQRLLGDRVVDLAGESTTTRQYLVQFTWDVPDIQPDYEVHVNAATNDPDLVGETLTAADVQHGSERFTRDVVCVHNQAPEDTDG